MARSVWVRIGTISKSSGAPRHRGQLLDGPPSGDKPAVQGIRKSYQTRHRRRNTYPNGYYPETSWTDDLELGAVEAARAARRAARPAGRGLAGPGRALGETPPARAPTTTRSTSTTPARSPTPTWPAPLTGDHGSDGEGLAGQADRRDRGPAGRGVGPSRPGPVRLGRHRHRLRRGQPRARAGGDGRALPAASPAPRRTTTSRPGSAAGSSAPTPGARRS